MGLSRQLRPMPLVIGGIVALGDIVGREREVHEIVSSVPTGGVILVGDRRHGKTSLTRLAHEAVRAAGHHAVQLSAERDSYENFARALADALGQLSSAAAREAKRWRLTLNAGPMKAERSPAPESDLDELIRAAIPRDKSKALVLFIDEITVLARNLERKERGSGEAFLHLLRRLRQEHPGRLATVLSGSIGFHHVSDEALTTVNDIPKLLVGPISEEDATWLAGCLLLGERVPAGEGVAEAVAAAAERIPYYVQLLVKAARDDAAAMRSPVTVHEIPQLLENAITNTSDPWNLRHYRDRIPEYYRADAGLVRALLDVYANSVPALDIDETRRLLSSTSDHMADRDQLVALVERLEQDHYLRRQGSADRFASELLRRSWVAMRR
ncbi:MAG: AAA family ATPase [Segniliparus sp.]|uniref:AAA family ATPase n=1 Tax=Segniliparus sp. TaxID=2804064 RepID=UPI003F2D1DE4